MSASRQVVLAEQYGTRQASGAATVDSQSAIHGGYGPRVADFLRRAYPDSRQKRIASDFDVSVGTAKNWLAGQCPKPHYLDRMRERWGRAFGDALNPHPLEHADALFAKINEIAQRLSPAARPTIVAPPRRKKPAAPVMADLLGFRDDLFGGL